MMDPRVISAFTRVFDALLPAHDASLLRHCRLVAKHRPAVPPDRPGSPVGATDWFIVCHTRAGTHPQISCRFLGPANRSHGSDRRHQSGS